MKQISKKGNGLKFKSVIIFFNILMLLFVGVMYIMPLAILGKDLARQFWQSGWFFAPLIIIALAFIDIYFILNYRIYTLLEKEDWPALIQELEGKVLQKNHFNPRRVKLLINSYLVLSDVRSVTELEKRLTIVKKSLLDENALSFCASRILNKDYPGAVAFLEPRCTGVTKVKGSEAEWLRWYYGFAQLLCRKFEGAADAFLLLAQNGRESILVGLSSYFLHDNLAAFLPRRAAALKEAAEAAQKRVKKSLRTRHDWDRNLKKYDTEVYVAVLQSYTGKAADYLYKP